MSGLSVTDQDRALVAPRPTAVDHDAVAGLYPLGNYRRKLPVSITRMMENAYDWEHLPFVHSSSFAAIDLIEEGDWGWRAKVEMPSPDGNGGSGNYAVLELLVDLPRNYWATTTVSGSGTGIHIHTQATPLKDNQIEIDVRFYLDEAPEKQETADFLYGAMKDLYARLYDEDVGLMTGRQQALDGKKQRQGLAVGEEILVGALDDLPKLIETRQGRFVVRQQAGQWIAYGADCPHSLGPLENAVLSDYGIITCPWHGYRFDIATGENLDGKCNGLVPPPKLVERDGKLYAAFD